jgi:hypothetical protein
MQQQSPICQCIQQDAIIKLNLWWAWQSDHVSVQKKYLPLPISNMDHPADSQLTTILPQQKIKERVLA